MRFIVISGFSGAGKSVAIDALEDIGYYCVDNIPPALMKNFAKLCVDSGRIDKAAFVTDTRGGYFFDSLLQVLDEMKNSGVDIKLLFLEASAEVLGNRYKETRRKHPLIGDAHGSIDEAVQAEHHLLEPVRSKADYIIDTSLLSTAQLKHQISTLFLNNSAESMNVHCMSFGFKYGPVTEADLMFDVRCLPNPYYIDSMRHKTGLDSEVSDYVMGFSESQKLCDMIFEMVDFLLPLYRNEGKSQLVIAIGCTGGKHRSVTFAERIYKHLVSGGCSATINHRDIEK